MAIPWTVPGISKLICDASEIAEFRARPLSGQPHASGARHSAGASVTDLTDDTEIRGGSGV